MKFQRMNLRFKTNEVLDGYEGADLAVPKNIIPRRIRLDLMKPAELSIYNAVQEVEKLGADVLLTEAVNLLQQARDKVSDHIDKTEGIKSTMPIPQKRPAQVRIVSIQLSVIITVTVLTLANIIWINGMIISMNIIDNKHIL
jgi:hypothetical protein